MRLSKAIHLALPLLAANVGLQAPAIAQRGATHAQHTSNIRAVDALRERIGTTDTRIAMARRGAKITAARATVLNRRVAQTRTEMTRLLRRQGFVSAAQLATYERTLAAIDVELDQRGVERGYTTDMLPSIGPTPGYGHDALPSAETTAFQKADARLRYRNARIGYDARGCATYEGTKLNGRKGSEPLLSPAGKPLCPSR